MKLSVIILTYNRQNTLLHTLERVEQHTSRFGKDGDTWVVDNGSTDGSADAVTRRFPQVNLIRRRGNEGIWARQYALDRARGDVVCFVDDDSYPTANAIARSVHFLEGNPQAAAVTGRIELADGTPEASALPAVPAIGGWCVRRETLQQAGGLNPCRAFVRQAEEYDLAFRILKNGGGLYRFEDLVYRHHKHPGARSTGQVHRLDVRNNLVVLNRYVPHPWHAAYRQDWIGRYTALARHNGYVAAAARGVVEADQWIANEKPDPTRTADPATLEAVFQLDHQARLVAQWAQRRRIARVCIADYSKNIYATYQACVLSGLQICAVADEHPAFRGLRYRGVPVRDDATAGLDRVDGMVLSNVNPAQVDRRFEQLGERFSGPILRLWHGQTLAGWPTAKTGEPVRL